MQHCQSEAAQRGLVVTGREYRMEDEHGAGAVAPVDEVHGIGGCGQTGSSGRLHRREAERIGAHVAAEHRAVLRDRLDVSQFMRRGLGGGGWAADPAQGLKAGLLHDRRGVGVEFALVDVGRPFIEAHQAAELVLAQVVEGLDDAVGLGLRQLSKGSASRAVLRVAGSQRHDHGRGQAGDGQQARLGIAQPSAACVRQARSPVHHTQADERNHRQPQGFEHGGAAGAGHHGLPVGGFDIEPHDHPHLAAARVEHGRQRGDEYAVLIGVRPFRVRLPGPENIERLRGRLFVDGARR